MAKKVGLHKSGLRLGPAGPFQDQLIIKIELKQSFEDLFKPLRFGGRPIRVPKDISTNGLLQYIRNHVMIPLETYMKNSINTIVPKDTGDLRNAMKLSISDAGGVSNVHSFDIEMYLNTGSLKYAKPVNQMPDRMLIHPSSLHTNWSYRKRPPGPKVDPSAKKNWFWLTVIQSRNKAFVEWRDFFNKDLVPILRRWPSIFPNPRKTLRSIFKVTIPGKRPPP